MANLTFRLSQWGEDSAGNPHPTPPLLAVDNGDGTFSLSVNLAGNPSFSASLTGTSRTASASGATASGSTAAGVKSVLFVASSDFSGTVLGQPLLASASLSFSAPPGDTLGSIAYTRSAGTLHIYLVA